MNARDEVVEKCLAIELRTGDANILVVNILLLSTEDLQ